MKVAVLQSNYLPWKGYFDLIKQVDKVIFYDDVQFTKNDWRNRNKIKTTIGTEWLTVPVGKSIQRLICEVKIFDPKWQEKHVTAIVENYESARYFHVLKPLIEEILVNNIWESLSDLNQFSIKLIANFLHCNTVFDDSRNYQLNGKSEERLLELLAKVNASEYFSGPAGKNYLKVENFESKGIQLRFADYSAYKEYEQLHTPFIHEVSVIDLIANTGLAAPTYI